MDKNKTLPINLILSIILFLVYAMHICQAIGYPKRNGEENDAIKQHRLFANHEKWINRQDPSDEFPEIFPQDKTEEDQIKNLFLNDLVLNGNPPPVFKPKEHKSNKPLRFAEPNYDYEYSSDRDLDPSLPYGMQNVVADPLRIPRAKTRITRIKFQSLCPSKRETIFLNLDTDYEYRPDHYEEVTCAHPFVHHEKQNKVVSPVCGEAGFSCIQLNRTIFLTRRAYGAECWESETRLVPAGCECMWPKHYFGDISAHH